MDPRDAFLERAKGGGIVPVVREVVTDADTPVAAFAKIARPPFAFLLESLVGGERWARYTFLGTEPREAWRYRGQQVDRWTPAAGWEKAGETADPVAHLADRMRALPSVALPGLPRFMGGAVGFLGYDVVRSIERLPRGPTDTLGVPDAVVMIADSLVILDNVFGRAIVVANVEVPAKSSPAQRLRLYDVAQERLDTLIGRLSGPHQLAPLALDDDGLALRPPPRSKYPRAAFERDVAKIREYIAAGDVFQAVLSRRQVVPGAVEPLRLYRYLRALNPAPYLFYLTLDDVTLVGSSPEVLVRVEGNEVTVRPIAGTRPRGASPEEDEALATSLRGDAKELAEHRMLVDLGRNDVGRVAEYGTVRVTESLQIERYSHVQHLVSEVRGRLKDGYDARDEYGYGHRDSLRGRAQGSGCRAGGRGDRRRLRAGARVRGNRSEGTGCATGARAGQSRRLASGPVYKLLSTSGEQSIDLQLGRKLVVGRAVTSDVPIYDPTISRRHAEVVLTESGVRVTDLGSSNGTFLNGAKITEAEAGANDVVTFGKVAFRVKEVTAPLPPPNSRAPSPAAKAVSPAARSSGSCPSAVASRRSSSTSRKGRRTSRCAARVRRSGARKSCRCCWRYRRSCRSSRSSTACSTRWWISRSRS